LFIHEHKFTLKHLCWHSITKILRNGPRAHFPFKFVLFVSYISCGLALPISPFFLLLLEEFGLQLQHLTPHTVL
jgi:hypothetical protein